ncbi:VOC family protein [Bacillus solimangrovi]|uniref:Glyoxalase n=1 Tax=Bacillus solimangrovi TaxID=1305675 RepID=A0A1E5LE58_9BACI|nr:VOC family protein [Bacillus solimangrovi]OEH92342.1 glyoxalase [Bacillus solimangrovi]
MRRSKKKSSFVHHICIQTNNYEQSLNFYRGLLGFELISESANFHNRHYNSWLRMGDFHVELQTGKIGEKLEHLNPNSQGIVHLCLWVENLSYEVEKFKKIGFEFKIKDGQEIYHVENGRLCKLIAPEGTIIELRDNRGI